MGERWVRPPLVAREPAPRWIAVWRYRAVMLLLAVALTALAWFAWMVLSGATDQDPGVDALRAAPGAPAAR